MALRIAVDLKIFETAVSDDGRPKTDAEIAAPTGASVILSKRITRVCVSMGFLAEAGPGLYVPNDVTRLLAQPDYAAGVIFMFVVPSSSSPVFRSLFLTPTPYVCMCVCVCS